MPHDYIPDSAENRYNWLVNLKTEFNKVAVSTLAWNAERVAAFNVLLDVLIAAYKKVVDAQRALDQATQDAADLFDEQDTPLREGVNQIKGSPGFTDGIGAAMKIFTDNSKPQPADIKPTLRVEARRGFVRLTGSKNYAQMVNIYMRLLGETQWRLIGVKRSRFPFDDQTPLKIPGIPETREYMAAGVIGDEEVGQPSDIVSAVFAG